MKSFTSPPAGASEPLRGVQTTLPFVFALFVAVFPAVSQNLPTAKPADVGLSQERLEKIMVMLREDTSKGVVPGAVLLVARHGKVAFLDSAGVVSPDTKTPMPKDAIFRIYSMSKAITTVSAMTLFEEGKFLLNDPISKYMPQFRQMKVGVETPDPAAGGKMTLELAPAKRQITIEDLMRHTSGITYGFFGNSMVKHAYNEAHVLVGDYTNAEFADRIAKLPLAYQPGTTWDYSHSTDILGRLVEVISGKSLYQFEKERLLDPLGMKDTGFYVTDTAKQSRIAEPFKNDRTIGVDATIGDPRVAAKWESGGGGMVGTASDYARFLQMMLNGGMLDGKRILSPATVAFMTTDHTGEGSGIVPGPLYLPGPGFGFGLGFAVQRTLGGPPDNGSVGLYRWDGVAGTHFWVDPKQDMFVVFMIQSPRARQHYIDTIRNMIYAAVVQ